MKTIDEIPTLDDLITKIYNIILYVISFENYIISTLALLIVFLVILHVYLLLTSEKYNAKITVLNSNTFFIWPSMNHFKLGLIGIVLFIVMGVIFIEI